MTKKRRNPDESLRLLEREAQTDPRAWEKLTIEKIRRGLDPEVNTIMGLGLNSLESLATDAKASGAAGYSTDSGRHSGTTLTDRAVRQWSTPTSSDVTGAGHAAQGGENLRTQAARHHVTADIGVTSTPSAPTSVNGAPASTSKLWPTTTTRDWKDGACATSDVPTNGLLGREAARWATPRATDGEKGGPNMRDISGSVPLPGQAINWPTPNALGGTGYMSGSNRDTWRPTLEGMAIGHRPVLHHGRPSPTTETLGIESLPSDPTLSLPSPTAGRRLNPRFVEWLQGLPEDWTQIPRVTASSASVLLATPSCPTPPSAPRASSSGGWWTNFEREPTPEEWAVIREESAA